MARAHDHLRRLLAGENAQGVRYRWHHALGLMHALSSDPSDETGQLLVEVALFEGRLALDETAGMPHSMPPEELLRALAIQLLARRDRAAHQRLFRRLARTVRSDRLAELARSCAAS